MCGIVGYIGNKEKKKIILDGLKELEYRGYDSAGIAVMKEGELDFFKAVGKLDNLANKTSQFSSDGFGLAIGHTRWATHGKPTEINAHPHLGQYSCVIHNGIIENYQELKEKLTKEGISFLSQTDTEVIVHLFEYYAATLSSFDAFKKTIEELKGAYAILLISKKDPSTIYFAKNAVPLIIGKNDDEDEYYFASSDAPLVSLVNKVAYLEDGDYGFVNLKECKLYHEQTHIQPNFVILNQDKSFAQKDGYRFFMEKEIYEQSRVLTEVLMGRLQGDEVVFEDINDKILENIEEITLCACGTSYHAALSGAYLLERLAKIKTKVEVASEFRYREAIIGKNTLFIVISQSGETADTLEALKIAKAQGVKTLAICNVDNSNIVRLADISLLTRAGIEKGVASTKAFATQVATLWMLAIYLAQKAKLDMNHEIKALRSLPNIVKVNQNLHEKVHRISKRYLHGHGFFFIGRDVFYPLALEGALKLKEISYLHAEGYPAGEMKHGPIALADSELFTVALMPKNCLYEKTKSNVEELAARDSTLLAISPIDFDLSDDFIKTSSQEHYMCEFFEMMVILQLLALEVSIRLGNDVDMPRNLAKSVTVE
ncbi:glutamine--fructose-6-phosphate transaminase (isomerizing) [Campylobacter insulaenigrae]|uniref:Glutamine--fructose-6-phosphate aminotransferase [isomerizing] n=1 Tax=Campylobacter insulaenigrae TaxID=260714 RepID=A0ABY3G4C2_9BACT|nr:glutamine--fructose-6-phosphate transaminase (isomerizing) [Campylobacter insulaenigrae]MCR6570514.1 glutamine--fructose-6-phosphate transaminase (isomerizing) [Campylobacter insulaenigrae]MCR6572069.1 glutamine--fructose-6-phosphate transaminase (isomerizing) [Campylobacter insulaenigrae]MCR6573777.1 glutamine--fructose-6-phosphate transaminase (isomerizing) [Campylobacter insulaenigrae]MCR6575539.1 glutamine--fructose-6-phosphate transaminase (isomerizing) [Campylobacter insulaenigrae]MCR